ncbi:hypothetical protein [Thiolapillus sp.]
MRKITRKIISVLLVAALTLAGLPSVGFAELAGAGGVTADMATGMPDMDHDCADCDPWNCCTDMNCQMTSHCLAHPAMPMDAGLTFHDDSGSPVPGLVSPSLPSRLIPTIYRPPWA